jgi:protein-tyrosine phosphatase
MIDIHTHILPGLDDGAKNWEESLQMAQVAAEDGITYIIATPHVIRGLYDNSKEEILAAVSRLNSRLEEEGIPLSIGPGAEYRLEADLAEKLKRGELLTLNDSGRYLLVELPDTFLPEFTAGVLYQIQLAGVTPIIAHPERNMVLGREPAQLSAFIRRGMAAQLTTGSIMGLFGSQAKKISRELLIKGLIHIVASDAHSPSGRTPRLKACRQMVSESFGDDSSRLLVQENPRRICQGRELVTPPLVEKPLWKRLRKRWKQARV